MEAIKPTITIFLIDLEKGGLLENTTVIIHSDHCFNMYGPDFTTEQRIIESNLP